MDRREETSRWVHFLYEPLAIRRFLSMLRKSTAALSTVAVEVSHHRIQPPANLTEAESTLFRQMVTPAHSNILRRRTFP